MEKFYELDLKDRKIIKENVTVYRIRAVKDFKISWNYGRIYTVKLGELGGYIEEESNLAQDGSWITSEGLVYGGAVIKNSVIGYKTVIKDNAVVENISMLWDSKISKSCKLLGTTEQKIIINNVQFDKSPILNYPIDVKIVTLNGLSKIIKYSTDVEENLDRRTELQKQRWKNLEFYKPVETLINDNKVINKNKKKMKKSMFEGMFEKMKSTIMPREESSLNVTVSGDIVTPYGDNWISLNKEGELISYPEFMVLTEAPVFSINKNITDVVVGDIVIKENLNVIRIFETEGGLKGKCICTGTSSTIKPIKDAMTGVSNVRVVMSFNTLITNGNENSMNNLLFMSMFMGMGEKSCSCGKCGSTTDSKNKFMELMMMNMFQQGNLGNMFTNMVNPVTTAPSKDTEVKKPRGRRGSKKEDTDNSENV